MRNPLITPPLPNLNPIWLRRSELLWAALDHRPGYRAALKEKGTGGATLYRCPGKVNVKVTGLLPGKTRARVQLPCGWVGQC